MLLRGYSDAIMMRTQQGDRCRRCPGLPAARSLQPDLFGARRDHDLFYGDAARDRTDELCRAVAARGARRGARRPVKSTASGVSPLEPGVLISLLTLKKVIPNLV